MINAPTENITLKKKDALAIEEGQKRLTHIETLISIQTKNLRTAKIDTENLTKEKLQLEDKISVLTVQVGELEKEVSVLNSSKTKANKKLIEIQAESAKIEAQTEKEGISIDERKQIIDSKERELVTRETNILLKEKFVEELSKSLEDKHEKIKIFASNI